MRFLYSFVFYIKISKKKWRKNIEILTFFLNLQKIMIKKPPLLRHAINFSLPLILFGLNCFCVQFSHEICVFSLFYCCSSVFSEKSVHIPNEKIRVLLETWNQCLCFAIETRCNLLTHQQFVLCLTCVKKVRDCAVELSRRPIWRKLTK